MVVDESATTTRTAALAVVGETVTLVAVAVKIRAALAEVVGLVVKAASALLAAVDCVAVESLVGVAVTLAEPDLMAELLAVEVGLVVTAASIDLLTDALAATLGVEVVDASEDLVADESAETIRLIVALAFAGFVAALVAATVGELVTPVAIAVCVVPPPVVTTVKELPDVRSTVMPYGPGKPAVEKENPPDRKV
jgi:hypothetical protein